MMEIPLLNFVPMHSEIKSDMQQAFNRVYESNRFVLGEEVRQFEKSYATFNQVEHCVGLSNGLDALHLSLKALGIKEGDEVLLPSNTYIATALAVSHVGAKPVFVEPNIDTYNIDVKCIDAAITTKTKVIMPVHLYGQSCEMENVMEIAHENNLFVIEDNAQAQGASFNNKLTGSWGHVNATSYYPGKNLGAIGDAGAVTTQSEELATKIKTLRNYGSNKKYYNEILGYNMRLDELQAAFLSVKLGKIHEWTRQRIEIASWYDEDLKGVSDLILPKTAEKATHVYHLFVVRTSKRNELQKYLNEKGIGTLIHYPIVPHMQEALKFLDHKKNDFPIAERIAETCLSLPLWPGLLREEVSYVSKCIKFFLRS